MYLFSRVFGRECIRDPYELFSYCRAHYIAERGNSKWIALAGRPLYILIIRRADPLLSPRRNILYIFMRDASLRKPDRARLTPGFDSAIEFRSASPEAGENDTAAAARAAPGSVDLRWRNETTLQEFPLKEGNPR